MKISVGGMLCIDFLHYFVAVVADYVIKHLTDQRCLYVFQAYTLYMRYTCNTYV